MMKITENLIWKHKQLLFFLIIPAIFTALSKYYEIQDIYLGIMILFIVHLLSMINEVAASYYTFNIITEKPFGLINALKHSLSKIPWIITWSLIGITPLAFTTMVGSAQIKAVIPERILATLALIALPLLIVLILIMPCLSIIISLESISLRAQIKKSFWLLKKSFWASLGARLFIVLILLLFLLIPSVILKHVSGINTDILTYGTIGAITQGYIIIFQTAAYSKLHGMSLKKFEEEKNAHKDGAD